MGQAAQRCFHCTAILDRFLHHAEIIQMTGQSYRLKDATERKKENKK
jgi:hypothetical protein